jgi:hypothetical protein
MRIYSLQIKTFTLVFEKNYIPHVKLKSHFLKLKKLKKSEIFGKIGFLK